MDALLCKKLGDPTVSPVPSTIQNDHGSPIVLDPEHPIPELKTPTSVLVRVKATSLNYANYLQILGTYQEKPPLPFIPGSDYSGVVEAIGSGVSNFRVGDKVCSFAALGSFAQFIVADESELFRVPEGCDLVAAGALPVAFGTSHVALVHRAQLTSGQVLLVLGAAGGVGTSAVQIGKVCGAIVIAVARYWPFSKYISLTPCRLVVFHRSTSAAILESNESVASTAHAETCRGAEKVRFLKSMGVDHIVDLSTENVISSVKEFLKAKKLKGVDVLYDPVGGKLTKESMKLLNWGAQILVIGFASGEIPLIPANIALVKNWTVHGLYWGSYRIHQPRVLEDSLRELLSWLAKGLITVKISHAFALSEANLAFAAIKDRKVIGKVMVICEGPKGTRSKI